MSKGSSGRRAEGGTLNYNKEREKKKKKKEKKGGKRGSSRGVLSWRERSLRARMRFAAAGIFFPLYLHRARHFSEKRELECEGTQPKPYFMQPHLARAFLNAFLCGCARVRDFRILLDIVRVRVSCTPFAAAMANLRLPKCGRGPSSEAPRTRGPARRRVRIAKRAAWAQVDRSPCPDLIVFCTYKKRKGKPTLYNFFPQNIFLFSLLCVGSMI